MKKLIFTGLFLVLFSIIPRLVFSQLIVNTGTTPQQMIQNVLVGTGVSVNTITFTGAPLSIGSFTTGATATSLGFPTGILLTTGLAANASNPGSYFASTINAMGSDPELAGLITQQIYDASVIEFNFIPQSDTIKFRYVFGSEEYPVFVNSMNDVFGFFISGPNPAGGNYTNTNIAMIPNTTLPVSINSVNNGNSNTGPCVNCSYYIDNSAGTSIAYSGMTTILTAWAKVIPCVQYHIKLAIGDAGDGIYDSGVFLEGNSFSSPHITTHVNYTMQNLDSAAIEGCSDARVTFTLPFVSPQSWIVNYNIGGTATNGVDYTTLSGVALIPAGSDSVSIIVHPLTDALAEPTETVILYVQNSICGNSYDTIIVNIINNNPLQLNTFGDTTICGGQALIGATVSGGILPYTYHWSNGATTATQSVSPISATTYTVSVTDACSAADTGTIFIGIGGLLAEAGPDVSTCLGTPVTLTASGGMQYLWSTGQATQSITVNPTTDTTYYVVVTQLCQGTDSVKVHIFPLPTVTSTPDTICAGESSTLSFSGGTLVNWASNPNDPTLVGQENSNNPVVYPNITTLYTVTVRDTNLCQNSATSQVYVFPQPVASFSTTPNPVLISNPSVFLSNTSSGNPPEAYWDLGDGSFSNMQGFSHMFPNQDSGTYLVTLIVKNDFGCADTTSRTVVVQPDYSIFVPNAISPNGDGKNEKFYVYAINIKDFHLQIFDRWGKKVFETLNIDEGWDGTLEGKEVPQGVYVYLLTYMDTQFNNHKDYGTVTLFR